MKITRYAISWIYGEFRIARLRKGVVQQSWSASEKVEGLAGLTWAMAECAEQIDLSRGGDVAIAYEDDLHTHEFFNVPAMGKKDLEKLLQRKVEQNKLFEDEAAWCYHEARHSDGEEGILLHCMPRHIVDAVIRICQEFYLTPKRLVPLTEIVSQTITRKSIDARTLVAVIALFRERTEIVVTLGDGEVLFVRELSYAADMVASERLQTDIDRTLHYCRQQFGQSIMHVHLQGESAERVAEWLQLPDTIELQVDTDANDALYWAREVAALPNHLSANFIPLLARKKINRILFARVAVWTFPFLLLSTLLLILASENKRELHQQHMQQLQARQQQLQQRLEKNQALLAQRDQHMQTLNVLQADSRNLPALLVSHLGELVPQGLVIQHADIRQQQEQWQVTLRGHSDQELSSMLVLLGRLEASLQQVPWNMQVSDSWKKHWYQQLQSGAAVDRGPRDFVMVGWMR